MDIKQIILASGSPRRKELLEQLGLDFKVEIAEKEEIPKGNTAREIVCHLSKNKAEEVAKANINWQIMQGMEEDNILVIGADTVVVLEGEILGKPKDEKEAKEMLNRLSGKEHSVYTGVALIGIQGRKLVLLDSFAEETKVTVFKMTQEEIQAYVLSGDPMDKAGAYGIQGVFAKQIKSINGEYTNVVGLPLGHLWQSIKQIKWK